MPYYSGTTEPLTRIMRRVGITAQVRARGTLLENLVKSKDKIKQVNKTGVVYFAPCAGKDNQPCETKASYIGETSRQGRQRFKEHNSTAKQYTGDYKSAIIQHAADTGHSFRETDLTILDSDSNWHSRGIRESIFTHRSIADRIVMTVTPFHLLTIPSSKAQSKRRLTLFLMATMNPRLSPVIADRVANHPRPKFHHQSPTLPTKVNLTKVTT